MNAVLADLSQWELFSSTLDPNTAGYEHYQRKIQNLRVILARLEAENGA